MAITNRMSRYTEAELEAMLRAIESDLVERKERWAGDAPKQGREAAYDATYAPVRIMWYDDRIATARRELEINASLPLTFSVEPTSIGVTVVR